MFDTLYDICNDWKLEVNAQKTKIAAFQNGGKLRNKENWSCNDYHIDINCDVNFLEVLLNSEGIFLKPRNKLLIREEKHLFNCEQVKKALY